MYLLQFIYRFLKGGSSLESITTASIDTVIKSFLLSDETIINCHIYDTAGQERYKALGLLYYQRADAVLLVYDISVKKKF